MENRRSLNLPNARDAVGRERASGTAVTHHIAVILPRYLEMILEGRKRVECRLLKIRRPPYRTVSRGDRIWLKASSGPVAGYATVEQVKYWENLTPPDLDRIQRRYNHLILAERRFWDQRQDVRYGVLIWLTAVTACESFRVDKRDRLAWVTLAKPLVEPTPGSVQRLIVARPYGTRRGAAER